ncbi:hypothetical protein BO99DRAFT_296319, partial [Aspergillus violaceofuscus CBS 115571]
RRIIESLEAILPAAGSNLNSFVEVSLYLSKVKDFDRFSAVYRRYWGDLKPSRTCVAVKDLPGGTDIKTNYTGVVLQT